METSHISRLAPNVGRTDRLVRIVTGLVLIVLALFVLEGGWALLSGIVSLGLIGTAFVSFCPIYGALGISTTRER